MKTSSIIFAFAVSLLALGCDKKPTAQPPPATTAAQADEEPTTGEFALKLKVSGSQAVYETAGAPKPEEVAKRIADGLYATDAFAPDGPRTLEGSITYDIKKLPNDAGSDLVLLGGIHSPSVKLNAGVNLQSTDDKWKDKAIDEMVSGAIDQFVDRISAQGRVLGGDDGVLAKILADSTESTDAHLMAIQEVRERKLEKLLPQVKPFLAPERDPGLRLAAAATLVSLGDKSMSAEILKVAEDFSRDRDPRMVPLLHILGDLGGTEVVTYLETVGEAHSAPAVRSVAQEALAKARNVPAQQ